MRIAMYHGSLPTPGRKPGGVEVFVDRLAGRLADAGHDVVLGSFGPPPEGAGYRHRRLGPRRLGDSRLARLTLDAALLNAYGWGDAEVLHLHGDDWFLSRRPLPTVRTFYGSALFESLNADRRRRRISQAAVFLGERRAARAATSAYAIGPDSQALYAPAGLLPLGVDIPEHVIPDSDRPPVILFVGTWHGRKRGAWLADLFAREIRPRRPDAELWMVSDRCEESPGIRFFHAPDERMIAGLYASARLLCVASTYEGFGLPAAEAMARGTPVVASPSFGTRHVLDGADAGLIAEDDRMVPALLDVFDNGELRERLRTGGRARAEAFGWPVVVKAHLEAYRRAVERFAAGVAG